MYGLPEDEDLSFLLGKELLQVCGGLHETILNFNEGTSITLQCEYALHGADDKSDAVAQLAASRRLLDLLGFRIAKVSNVGKGSLAVTFSDGSVLSIHDSNSQYESYEISDPTKTIVV